MELIILIAMVAVMIAYGRRPLGDIKAGIKYCAILLALFGVMVGTAQAAEYEYRQYKDSNQGYLLVHGEIKENENLSLSYWLDQYKGVKTVHLHSGGGMVNEAWKMAEIIRDRGLNTAVTRYCASACTMVFMGGVQRFVREDAEMKYHYAYRGAFSGDSTGNDIYAEGQKMGMYTISKFAQYVENGKEWPSMVQLLNLYEGTSKDVFNTANNHSLVAAGLATRVY